MRVALRVNGWVSAVLSMVVAGCGAQSQVPPFTVTDSAGIQIVETATPLWSSGASWTVSDTPVLVIGEVEGRAHEVFAGITGVVRMSDGRIAVADRGSSEIRFFGSDGRFLGASGRSGMGPGEFQVLHGLYALDGDSLLAFDGGTYRFSIFDGWGAFVRVFHPETVTEGLVWPLSAIGQRRILLGAGRPFGGQLTPGVHMDTASFMIADLDGEVEAVIGRFPFYERYVHIYPDGVRSTIGLPFGRSTLVVAGRDRMYSTATDGFQIHVRGFDGRLERIIRIRRAPRPVTEADTRRYVRDRQRLTDPRRRRVEARLLREIPFPETFPPFANLVLDSKGYLWAQEYRGPGERSTRWMIVDPDGRWLGTVEGPDAFRLHRAGGDYLLGIHADELGVEQVRMYRLSR